MRQLTIADIENYGIERCEKCGAYPEAEEGIPRSNFDLPSREDIVQDTKFKRNIGYVLECPICHKRKWGEYPDTVARLWNKAGKEYWRQQAISHAAAAGEYKISISLKREMVKKEIERAEITRLSVMTETDLAYIDGRIQELKKFRDWLEGMEKRNEGKTNS